MSQKAWENENKTVTQEGDEGKFEYNSDSIDKEDSDIEQENNSKETEKYIHGKPGNFQEN